MSSIRLLTTVIVAGLVALPATAVLAAVDDGQAEQAAVRVERVDLAPDGTSRLSISVAGLPDDAVLDAESVTLVENGTVVEDLRVTGASGEASEGTPATVLVVDTSGSTEGEPIAAAIAAGQALVEEVEGSGGVTGLVEFGPEVEVRARLEDPPGTVTRALAALESDGATRLFDGIARGTRLLIAHDGARDLVVFSDGADTESESDLDTIRSLAVDGEVRVTSVALDTGELDLAPLEVLAEATGGSVIRATDPGELLAIFQDVAEDLTTRFVLEWSADPVPVPPAELSFEVRIATAGASASDRFVALNPRSPAITAPEPYEPPGAPVPMLEGQPGLVVAGAATFLAVLVMGALLFTGVGERRRRELLARRLDGWDGVGEAPDEAVVAAASLSERAADVVGRIPKPKGLEDRLDNLLERADWPMRATEFELLSLGTTLGGLLVPLVLLRNLPLAILGLLLGLVGPFFALQLAVGRRARAFEDQLPSVLSLLAGALRAGHSFSTALDGTIRETDEPAHSELRRAAVEHRLGRPVGEALLGVANRMHSDDLRWVVTAINIQQDVGGNLAELLDNVASTLRDRASLVRTVRALSAEGRLSAWVIGAMPFGMFIAMSAVNREYTAVLYQTSLGRAMLVVGALLLVAGSLWLRSIVQPRY